MATTRELVCGKNGGCEAVLGTFVDGALWLGPQAPRQRRDQVCVEGPARVTIVCAGCTGLHIIDLGAEAIATVRGAREET